MNTDILREYMIGYPRRPGIRGRDIGGFVHCILWLQIYKKNTFFAKPNRHTLARNGCGIGGAVTVKEAKAKLQDYARQYLTSRISEIKDDLRRYEQALISLEGPTGIAQWEWKGGK